MKERILLAHGSGGRLSHELIQGLFLRNFDNQYLRELSDSAVFSRKGISWAFTTDSYVVKPLFFPGGDIGKLAVSGTINDLAVMGARPVFLSCAFIIEEGLSLSTLKKVILSMRKVADTVGVQIIAGDTKVVEHHNADELFINTSGIGIISPGGSLSPRKIEVGDKVIINGTIGDHFLAILSQREGFDFQIKIKSDCAPLNDLISRVLNRSSGVKLMRDPTRGGLATILNEMVSEKEFGIELWEKKIPLKEEVMAICEILGFDPLYLANEGKVVLIVKNEEAQKIVDILRSHPLGRKSEIIGAVVPQPKGKVYLRTSIGTSRIVDMLSGDQLPRIC